MMKKLFISLSRRLLTITLFHIIIYSVVYSSVILAEELQSITVDSYDIKGDIPLNKQEVDAVLHPYTGKKITLEQLQQAVEALENQLRQQGYGFYKVALAPQTLSTGKIVLSVSPLTIKLIDVYMDKQKQAYYSKENIRASIPSLSEGKSPNLHHVAQQLELANLNVSKQANVQFSVDEDGEQINANIFVSAEKPYSIFSWLNNTGSDDTGDYRLGIGYKHVNLFDKDHELSLTMATSPEQVSDVQQYGASYRIPFYEYQGVWEFFAFYSDVDSGIVAGGFDVSGKGTFLGTRYEWYLPKLAGHKNYAHHLEFALNDKLFDNNVFFLKDPLGVDVRSTPVSLIYHGKWLNLNSSFDYYLGYDHNIEVGSHNNKRAYALSRYNASPNWDSFKMGFNHIWSIKEHTLTTSVDAQYSDDELISGEQFGMGGTTGRVRGFEERELTGDKGIRASIELLSPAILNDQMNLLAFADIGYVSRNNPLADEFSSDTIASIGLGAKWQWRRYVNASVYFAHVINGNDFKAYDDPTESGDNKIHFSIFVNY